MVKEMAMNAVIQKQAGNGSIAFTKSTPQSIIIPRGTDGGIQVAASALTPNYITVNQLPTTQTSAAAVLASGGQVIQGSPFAFSQIQDLSQAGMYIYC